MLINIDRCRKCGGMMQWDDELQKRILPHATCTWPYSEGFMTWWSNHGTQRIQTEYVAWIASGLYERTKH